MSFKFKVGDKVKVIECPFPKELIGEEGKVVRLGGTFTPDKGAVVYNEKFPTGEIEYGEHGLWFNDSYLELVERP